VRIAYVTESFPPDVNGVASTAMRVADQLSAHGHQPLVIAPRSARRLPDVKTGFPVVRVPSVGLPLYPGFRVGLPGPQVRAAITGHRADLVHLAGPVVLGAGAGTAASRLGIPCVAVYATDMAAYARTYHLGSAGEALGWRHLRGIHNATARSLAPSSATADSLRARGFQRVHVWGRGVDTVRFDQARRSQRGHRMIARSFHGLLAAAGHQLGPAPAAEPANPPPSRLAEVGWMATKGTAWVLRRSTDLVPCLLAMATAEVAGSARRALRAGCWPRARVDGQPAEQLAQPGGFLIRDALAQPLVESQSGDAQRQEHLIAVRREPHDMDAAVRRVAVPADQAGALHRVQVVRQRGFPDPDRVS
jgi:hypothetical protein